MKIARLNMDSQDKTRFEIQGKASVKYHLKANHVVEAKRWFWTLNNAIRWAKDEALEEQKRQSKNAEAIRKAKMDQIEGRSPESPSDSTAHKSNGSKHVSTPSLTISPAADSPTARSSMNPSILESAPGGDDSTYDPSIITSTDAIRTTTAEEDEDEDVDDDDDEDDDESSRIRRPNDRDALEITAQSAKIQLDLLATVSSSLRAEGAKNPDTTISDPAIDSALTTYQESVSSLRSLMYNLFQIYRDRDAYWHSRLSREENIRRMWEESMAKVAQEHEDLQAKIGESEEKRRRTKRALREALGHSSPAGGTTPSRPLSYAEETSPPAMLPLTAVAREVAESAAGTAEEGKTTAQEKPPQPMRSKTALSHLSEFYDSGSDDEDEFFDAIDTGDIQVEDRTAEAAREAEKEAPEGGERSELRAIKRAEVAPSFEGYEDPVRVRLALDNDNRPKVSLWVRQLLISDSIYSLSDGRTRASSNP